MTALPTDAALCEAVTAPRETDAELRERIVLTVAVSSLNLQKVLRCRELHPEIRIWNMMSVNPYIFDTSKFGVVRTEQNIIEDLHHLHEIIHALYAQGLPPEYNSAEISELKVQCHAALRFINRQEELPMIKDFLHWLRNLCVAKRGRWVYLDTFLWICIREGYPMEALDWALALFPEDEPAGEKWDNGDCRRIDHLTLESDFVRLSNEHPHMPYQAWLDRHITAVTHDEDIGASPPNNESSQYE